MRKFAFIIFAENPADLRRMFWYFRLMPAFVINMFLKSSPCFRVSKPLTISSIRGNKIEGSFIICPLFPNRYMPGLYKEFVLDRVITALDLVKQLKADIVGFDRWPAVLKDKEQAIINYIKIPITTAKALTAWSIFEAFYRVFKTEERKFKQVTLAVIGATKLLQQLCIIKCAPFVNRLVLFDRNPNRLLEAKEKIIALLQAYSNFDYRDKGGGEKITASYNLASVVEESDIIINALGFDERKIIDKVKPGALIFNLFSCVQKAKKAKLARNINIVKTGLIKLPFDIKLGFNTGLPSDIICSTLAETILFTFEGKFSSYSLGEEINPDILEETADMAARHGFEIWVPEAPPL